MQKLVTNVLMPGDWLEENELQQLNLQDSHYQCQSVGVSESESGSEREKVSN